MTRIVIASSGLPGSTGRLTASLARARGHDVHEITGLDAPLDLDGAAAVILIPLRGDARRHAYEAVRALAAAAPPRAHLVLLSSFVVGHGEAHGLGTTGGADQLRYRTAAEEELRRGTRPYTIVRPVWLTDDPAGSYAVTVTQDPHADGMVARADVAGVLVAAVADPAARGTTFALYNEPGAAPRTWSGMFSALRPDAPHGADAPHEYDAPHEEARS
jgi:uncharacterized protein YbjT (DUF2867 family)